MMSEDFAARVSGIGALAEPARRTLYQYVASQPDAVSRDQAAAATGVARHTVKFHLDKLVEEGLLAAEFRRLSGREGPGAGRPSKLYRRAAGEVSVSLPERRYDLAGQILAAAIERASAADEPVLEAVAREAASAGRALAARSRTAPAPTTATQSGAHDAPAADDAVDTTLAPVLAALAENGYEPREVDGAIVMANCPFHALATGHTELVCGLNLELLTALAAGLGRPDLRVVLDPAPDRCCVTLRQVPDPGRGSG